MKYHQDSSWIQWTPINPCTLTASLSSNSVCFNFLTSETVSSGFWNWSCQWYMYMYILVPLPFNVSSRAEREAEDNLLKRSKKCQFGHFHHSNFLHVHVLRIVWFVAIFKGGGSQPPRQIVKQSWYESMKSNIGNKNTNVGIYHGPKLVNLNPKIVKQSWHESMKSNIGNKIPMLELIIIPCL